MHMSADASNYKILKGDETFIVKSLWARLNPSRWPLRINDFPQGSLLVGGAVRDAFLGRFQKGRDLDFVVPFGAIDLAKNFALNNGGTCVTLDAQRDIARLILKGWTIDISKRVGSNLKEDLIRRDFTINAIGLTLDDPSELIDPTLGIRNLKNQSLAAISQQNLIDDPLRLLRALRFKAELNFDIEPKTICWIKSNYLMLRQVAPERIQNEISRLIHSQWAHNAFPLIRDYGLLDLWTQTEFQTENWAENLSNAKNFTEDEMTLALPLARLTSLLSDDGLEYLRFSRSKRLICKRLRKWQSRYDGFAFSSLTESERFQLHKELESCLPAIILDFPEPDQRAWILRWRDKEDPLFHPRSPIDGNALKEIFGLSSGPDLGKLLDYLCHERAFDRLNNYEKVLQAACDWLKRNATRCD